MNQGTQSFMSTQSLPFDFDNELLDKIAYYKALIPKIKLGKIIFDSPLLLAPMAGITQSPFRLLMQNLGAGGAVSELISAHGINYLNSKTLEMLTIDSREKNVGIQLFGDESFAMAEAAFKAQEFGPQFIDVNLGCPVRKVFTKGAGSALLGDPKRLEGILLEVKKRIQIPLTIKIRTGLDELSKNADEIVHLAASCGVNSVAIHGRTRAQQYRGNADWEYIHSVAKNSPLPIIGNGDLHTPEQIYKEWQNQTCQGLMLGRGPLRSPFLFLESFDPSKKLFRAKDHWQICLKLLFYMQNYYELERVLLVQFRKHVAWLTSGMPNCAKLRTALFTTQSIDDVLELGKQFFDSIDDDFRPQLEPEAFMASGHG